MSNESSNLAPADPRNLSWVEVWVLIVALSAMGAAGAVVARHGMGQGAFLPVLAFVVCALAAAFDTAVARIPNPLTYSAILLGLGLNGAATAAAYCGFHQLSRWMGADGVTQSLAGFAVCAGVGLPCVLLGLMGGGDMKLLAATGAILGLSQTCSVLLYALAFALVYGVANLLITGRLNALLRSAAVQLLTAVCLRQPPAIEAPSSTMLPAAMPLLVGLLLWRIFGAWW